MSYDSSVVFTHNVHIWHENTIWAVQPAYSEEHGDIIAFARVLCHCTLLYCTMLNCCTILESNQSSFINEAALWSRSERIKHGFAWYRVAGKFRLCVKKSETKWPLPCYLCRSFTKRVTAEVPTIGIHNEGKGVVSARYSQLWWAIARCAGYVPGRRQDGAAFLHVTGSIAYNRTPTQERAIDPI